MKIPIYMDYHATTPVDSRVIDVMLPYFSEKFGNPASRQHQFGWVAEESVESARSIISKYFASEPKEIIFTSGATESNNLVLKGIAEGERHKGNHIVTVQTEHKSVLDTCKKLEKIGCLITYLPVDENGLIDLDQLKDSLRSDTILVSVMFANNEIGTIQDISNIGRICREKNILFHTDATQALGKISANVNDLNIDLMSFSGHKIYGPKGIGGLYIRSRKPKIKLTMQIDGGGQEKGLRSGTLNVPSIVGLAKALELSVSSMSEESNRIKTLRDKMYNSFIEALDEVFINGHPTKRIPNNLNISFLHAEDNALMMSMKEIALSTGSACTSSDSQPSHVLRALKLSSDRIHSAIRFGLGRFTTSEEVDYVINRVIENVKKLRELSPAYSKKRNRISVINQ